MSNLRKTCSRCNFEQPIRTNKCPNCGSTLTKLGKVRGRPVGTTVAAGYTIIGSVLVVVKIQLLLPDIMQAVDVLLVPLQVLDAIYIYQVVGRRAQPWLQGTI